VQSLKNPIQWIGASLILLFVVAVALAPMVRNITTPSSRSSVHDARTIGLALFSYSIDHNGAYPTGKSSTDVFQKLIDGGYISDPALLYTRGLKISGKVEATSKTLKPENVCFDVTVPVDANSSDLLPVFFLTGYRINYVPGGSAVPFFLTPENRPKGIAVCYHGNNAAWLKNDGLLDGVVTNFISQAFDPAGKKYQQLTPDGPFGP